MTASVDIQPLVETRGLKKYFRVRGGLLHAVDDVNITILPKKTLGVVGESGCGKSTLGRTLIRLLEPTEGQVLFDGQDISRFHSRQLQEMRRKMQIIFQDPYSSLDPRMSVAETIAEFMLIHRTCSGKQAAFQRAAELMDIVGLARRCAGAYPHELDGGRRQRIGIARALSLNPEFIVCDEPVSALDVSIQAQILNLLMDIQEDRGLTYMFITHDLSVVRHISDEIVVMYLGQCVEHADSDSLFENPLHPYTKALLSAIPEPDITMRNKEIKPIRGELASPVNPPAGCRFAARCDYTRDVCRTVTPPLRSQTRRQDGAAETASGKGRHFVACHLFPEESAV
ncbi:MAG: ATP-binding cassette domain-containing protein [Synergistaceae bacterium]|jgi:oligopeptide/dipeptide ABC transporter ATP-binding protein|nr:ATP-binding cassette domain-containing protein [Synergistaceae bacterium]